MKDRLSPTRRGINVFREALKSDLSVVEVGDCFNQVFERHAGALVPSFPNEKTEE